jgi:small subunit ribosomal protein S13
MPFTKFGIGLKIEKNFKNKFGINKKNKINVKTKHLLIFKKEHSFLLTDTILFNNINANINFYKQIKCYKGNRHKNNYPVRGQRTHTNATKKIFKSKKFL